MSLPPELPLDGAGYGRKMAMHMNFGGGAGGATYTIHGPGGVRMPISYQYDTRKKDAHPTGYFIDGVERCFKTWREVAEYWPEFIKSKSEAPA